MAKRVELSIVITAHREGLIAHKTMMSVFRALEELDSSIKTEINVHIDCGDADTINYFNRYTKDEKVNIYQTEFGDIALSRNFAVKKAAGQVLTFIDADDLMSSNWLKAAYRMVSSSDAHILIHPEAELIFGINETPQVFYRRNSTNQNYDAHILLGQNLWCSVIMGNRLIFEEVPYRRNGNGYGHEDYTFNIETISKEIPHKVAKDTVVFVRKKSTGSVSDEVNSSYNTQPYSPIFSIEFMNKHDNIKSVSPDNKKIYNGLKTKVKNLYVRARNTRLNYIIEPFAEFAKKILRKDGVVKKDNSKGLIREWKNINKIESQLYPDHATLSITKYQRAEQQLLGSIYHQLMANVDREPDYVFIVPWVIAGGADKVLINYLKAFQEIHPKWSIAVIATTDIENKWSKMLPENTSLIEFGRYADKLVDRERDTLFSRIMVQLNCKKVHIINSEYGYKWVSRHKELVENNGYTINVSSFCYDIRNHTELDGIVEYADPYLVDIYPLVNKIFTDNYATIKYNILHNGMDENKFKVHYQPIELSREYKTRTKTKNEKIMLLWAGRIAEQKVPTVLRDIGKKLDPRKFRIDVYGRFESGYNKKIFNSCPAIKYHGGYDGFSSLPLEKYDMFLYTSFIDGVPNTILEAIAFSIPVIAGDVGGINEVIKDRETGILVKNHLDSKEYIDRINDLYNNQDNISAYINNAQELLKKRHSWKNFIKSVKDDM